MRQLDTINCGDCVNKTHMGGCKIFYNQNIAWINGSCKAKRIYTNRRRNKLDEYNTKRINNKT